MNKIFFGFILFVLTVYISSANLAQSRENVVNSSNSLMFDYVFRGTCNDDKYCLDDDEYCVYNECYFDKNYRNLKKQLCLSITQENDLDSLYRQLKSDFEYLYSGYKTHKNHVLDKIACNNQLYMDEVFKLSDIKHEMKSRINKFKKDVLFILNGKQIKVFKCVLKNEKYKMKKILKYGAIYKFPCTKNVIN